MARFDFVFMFAFLYHLREPLHALEIVSSRSDQLYLETIDFDDEENSHLRLQQPRPGIPSAPKCSPTTRCLNEMPYWVGFTKIEEITAFADDRPIYRATR